MAIPSLQDLPNIYKSEWAKFDELTKTYPITTTGAYSFTMASSGVTYSTVNGGLLDIFTQLQTVLLPYLVTSSYMSSIISEINNRATNNDLQETRALLERQLGYNLWINQTGYGAYTIFDNLSDGVINTSLTSASIDTINKNCTFDSSGANILTFNSHTYTNNFTKILCRINSDFKNAFSSNNYTGVSNISVVQPNYTLTTSDKLYLTATSSLSKKEISILNVTTSSLSGVLTFSSTSGYITRAKPKVLSDGRIINCIRNTSNKLEFWVTGITGTTNLLTTWTDSIGNSFSFEVIGTNVYAIVPDTVLKTLKQVIFDINTVGSTITTTQTVMSGFTSNTPYCSIISNFGSFPLMYACAGVVSGYPNSNNIFYVKSNDGINFTKQDGTSGIDQITTLNTSGQNYSNPMSILCMNNGLPIILASLNATSSGKCSSFKYTTSWQPESIIFSTTYTLGSSINIDGVIQKYGSNIGRIWVTFYNTGATGSETVNNIRCKYSDDGTTWTNGGVTNENITSDTTYAQLLPQITTDIDGNIYIVWQGITSSSGGKYNIRYIKRTGSTWGSIIQITNQSSIDKVNPYVCNNYYNFTEPYTVFFDANAIYFSGINTTIYNLTLSENINASIGEGIPITTQFKVSQNSSQFNFDSYINNEYLQYYLSTTSSNIANLTVRGKSTLAKAVGYSVY